MTINGKAVSLSQAYDALVNVSLEDTLDMLDSGALVISDAERESLSTYAILRSNLDYRKEVERVRAGR